MPGPVNSIQSVGNFTATYSNLAAAFLAGLTVSLQGFKLEDVFVTSEQELDNAKNVPLVNGGVITLVNAQKAGKLTINATHFSSDPTQGDFVLIAQLLQSAALSVGGLLRFTTGLNGSNDPITFFGVTIARVPPIMLAGNDVPAYPVVVAYQSWDRI
jgi:hypothetical protein